LATYDKIYFSVINILKIALPAIGVSLIIAMFILSRDQVSKAALPFDTNKFEHELVKQQINQFYYSGQTDAGDELALSAQVAGEGLKGQDKLEMKSVSATVKTKFGLEINAIAEFGEYSYSEKLLKMTGSVLISSSTGYQLSTPILLVSTDGTYIRGNGPVEGFSPMGKIKAGKIEIKRENANAPMQLWLSEKVMIDYEPKEI
jgi:lipopolysaccharide export system protein LptC